MLGASVYLSTDLSESQEYLKAIQKYGGKYVFTSMHIPEEDSKQTLERIRKLADIIKNLDMKLMVDVSSATLNLFQVPKENIVSFFKEMSIHCLRIDYGFSIQEIVELQKDFEIILNASTIDEKYAQECLVQGLKMEEVTVCHNYYPRKDTGLSREFFLEKNQFLKSFGFKVLAFIPGDESLRGPVFEGLPTIEEHRKVLPLIAYIDLIENLLVDEVLVGDIRISTKSLTEIQTYHEEKIILLEAIPKEGYSIYFDRIHTNRKDVAKHVIRSVESRVAKDLIGTDILADAFPEKRPKGSITLDNQKYLRYMGELQIARVNLEADERVNVIGHIKEEYIPLLPYIQSATKFYLKIGE